MNASCRPAPPPRALPRGARGDLAAPGAANLSGGGSCEQVPVPPAVFLALGAASLLENALVLAAVARNARLHSPMYFFLGSLAAADLLVSASNALETALIAALGSGALALEDRLVQLVDNVFDSVICASLAASICSLLAVAVDRYVTVFFALRYRSVVTARRALAGIAAVWAGCGVCGVVFIVHSESETVVVCLVALFLAMLLLMAALYLHLLLFARLHVQRIAALPPAAPGAAPPPARSGVRGAVTVTLLLGAFVFCWAPFFLHLVLIVTCPANPYCVCYTAHFNAYLVLIMCNSVIDPLIYAFRSPELRHTFKELLCGCRGAGWG